MKITHTQVERVRRLAAALRSGKYNQCRRHLRNGEGYCCLGVACDLYSKESGNGKWEFGRFHTESGFFYNLPPEEVGDFYGSEVNPTLRIKNQTEAATIFNDVLRCSFIEIAEGFDNLANDMEKQLASLIVFPKRVRNYGVKIELDYPDGTVTVWGVAVAKTPKQALGYLTSFGKTKHNVKTGKFEEPIGARTIYSFLTSDMRTKNEFYYETK